ncbi:dynein axonemal heavy chain 8 isoform X8 [Vespa velutina]|uniref:dynein axonemal heavy chain 8 isoform X8 n=1 Tax=Vespa velutina TaxID=202808 RepID=UPI001FB25A8C|nr:dynein axonemal heavy chain 8 isoform X8 [Vespa velutina]
MDDFDRYIKSNYCSLPLSQMNKHLSSSNFEGGKRAIIIHYQYMTPPSIESGRWTPQYEHEKQILRCCITDGTTEQFYGKSIIVYRLRTDIEFEPKHLMDETYYAYAEVDLTSQSPIAAISDLISRLNEPAIKANVQWGELSKTERGFITAKNFIHDFSDFCEFLNTINIDLQGIVNFEINWDLYNKYLTTQQNVELNAKNREVVETGERNVQIWMKTMERAIVESQQLRRETEVIGPTGELAYWRRLLIRFSSIIECIKSPYTQAFIELLIRSNSKLMKKWKKLINHVITVQILAQDNVTYLYALEKFTKPLYRLDPTKIGKYLPALMYVVRMVYATSRFFNTRRMITAVFVKMTNQMILACKGYLTYDGTLQIWHDSKSSIISRIKDCIALYTQYYEYYDEMCKKVKECADEKPFEVSDMYVFGKFKTFKKRLIKIMDVFEITLTYSILQSSTLEGIDAFNAKFISFFNRISSKNYDPLDHRKPYFNSDYDEFKNDVAKTEIELRTFFYDTVSVTTNIETALIIVARFQKLNLKCLRIDRKYLELTNVYQNEIEEMRDRYNEDRSSPPIPRNIPSIAGRIFWIRQLYRRIEGPMNVFKTRKRVITHEYMQKCIKLYNAIISVFIHYEIIYHKSWYDSCEIVRLALSAPLFVRHPKTNKYCLNFDRFILEVIRESEHMSRFGLEVPDFIQIITICKEKIFSSYNEVKNLLEENDALSYFTVIFRRSIPIIFLNLIKIALVDLEVAFQPCLSVISWASLKISNTCENIKVKLLELQNFVKEIKDMKETRVDEMLELISSTTLLKINNYPKTPAEFLTDNIHFINIVANDLEVKSSMAEQVVIKIINKFMDLITDPNFQDIKYDWMDPEQLTKPVGSATKLISGPYETGKLKLAFSVEASAWKKLLGSALSINYKNKLMKISEYINEKNKVLLRPIKDLEDVRIAMKCLSIIRDDFITFDMELILIEETYTLMGHFNIDILKEEQDIVDSLRFNFNNMLDMAKKVQETICEMQEPLKKELIEGVAILIEDVAQFDVDFELEGPMIEGIPAAEASERVVAFQARFDELWDRYETYSSGETLFGIPVREYPELQHRKRELNLLQKLYSLYAQVIRTIDSYYSIAWSDIDIESIVAELTEFQNKCRRLPKAMREWPAYIDLKKKIDDFSETCPLLEMMANKAMKARHWERMSKLCHFFFDVESETFTLANALEAPLLKYKDDVEDICISAVKETDIERKLKQVIADWAVVNLQFSHFKQRGELLLKGVETAEIISQLEDSLMVISSLMANRYNTYFKKDIQLWQKKLSNTSEILSTWLIVQNLWAYLEAVFIGGDISKQLPAEAKRFNVALLAIQVIWTRDAEAAMNASRRDKTIMRKTNEWFLDLLNALIEVTVKDLTSYARKKYEALITIHVHQRDIFDELYHLKIRNVQDFEWLKQSRFYYNDDKEQILIRITDVEFIYQNEFLGCSERLVITPLTDRCYITLSQAVGMNFGGAPAGPAGTGKTETTKDMGKALGKYVVVFNCSDQMDFRGLGRIFKGLAQAGIWGCFDEFNRIELPVLSVAAQQIAIVLNARKERKTHFLFSDGETYKLNYEVGIFITMNPGYAGRQELPENLKIQFRSVAMMVPDRQIIMRVKLAACGFLQNIMLARKFFTLYALCEEQLSKQVHYDFGLRNILSCLRTLGAQKRARPNESEETTLMRVLRDMNLSKLVDEDEPLFISLIEDMFPGIKLTTQTYKELQKGIEDATVDLGIMNHPEWNLKTIQLYETSLVRHGLMVLGPTGTGKTRCMWALMKALTQMGIFHKEVRMNPKAITASQMFGKLDVATNDWTDGIFSTLWRRSVQMKKTEHLWIVLDGPVDAVWIENLNSVLDDNKTLTLANGDRIIMSSTSKLVFEPDNVDNASPATISRMGMVFISSSVLKWHNILEAWLKTRPNQEVDILRSLFRKIYDDALVFVLTKLQAKMTLLEAIYIRQTTDLLNGLLTNNDKILNNIHIEKLFLFSIMWSLGAVLELDARYALQEFLLAHKSHCHWPTEDETIFEYLVSDQGSWIHWNDMVPEFEYPSDHVLKYYKILVPNVDNTRTLFLIDIIAKQEKAVLLIGEQGTAKTVMIKSYMSNFDSEYHLQRSFNFSSASTPNMVQRVFESYVEKRVGNTYGPPSGRKLTVFIDDINMPEINEWGDQITNEVVRQLMEYKGFYSLDKPGDFSTLQDIMILAAMIHPGGGRNDIPPRLKRQFNIFNCTLPSNKSMDAIFGKIGQGYFCLTRFSEVIVNFIPKLVPLTRILWQKTKIKMLPTPAKFHYVFNLRDLSRIWEGILKIERAECETITTLLKLWDHECSRVISDRFITAEDNKWFHNALKQTAEEILDTEFRYYEDVETYFVNFLRDPPEPTGDEPEDFVFEAPKIYEEIPSYKVVIKRVKQNMEQFNEYIRGIHLDLVLFHDALVHLIRISRILGSPRSHAMLVGVGGSGKQSLTRLASFIAGFTFFQITLSRIYNVASLMDDLKKLYREAGTVSKGLTFIFTDNEIKDEAFLEYINNILSVGEIAGLFPKDELDDIYTIVTPLMRKDDPKRPPLQDNLHDYFITRARDNLHIVLCFSPVGEKFRLRALKFPALISGCTMNWFSKWPKDALYQVGEHVLNPFEIQCTSEVKQQLIQVMGDIQDDVNDICIEYFNRFRRQTYVTPKSFLVFLNGYKEIYEQNLNNINMLAVRMSNGLSKLVDAAIQVDELRKILEKNLQEIAQKNIQVEAIVITVNEKKSEAETVKATVQITKNQAEALLKVIAADKLVAEKKLKAAEPALLEAEAALQTIKASDIATVRKLAKPPYLITLIMDCVLILFGKKLEHVKPDPERQFLVASWTEAFKVMTDTRFLYNLQQFPKDNINGEIVDLMYPYLNYPLYTYEAAKQACGNVAGLIQWTIAMVAFYGINKDVLPLKANLAIQEGKYERANRNLRQAEALLKEKDEDLRQVQKEYDAVMQERQIIVDQAEAYQAKTDTATAMIEGLSGERVRWTEQVALFKSEIERLVGDVVILTGFLSYCGPFNQEIRVLLQRKWFDFLRDKDIPCSKTINIVDVLTDTATIGEWNLQGLPTDELSIQNGIIVTKAIRYPLLIDPQLQGKTWIKNKEKDFELQITLLSHKYFRNHLEDSVSLGRPLLIEDVAEELDPVLDNLLEKNFIKIGTTYKVKLGDKEVDISKDFRLYITTKFPNPSYNPEVFARVSVIDFTVTMKGLEDQLLGRVILTEEEELETERVQLIADVTANRRNIKELEANLLHKLTTVQGPLIEDVELMTVLNTTKQTAAEVNEKLNIARETEIKIDAAREEYRPIATRGSVLYFLICDMAHVNSMYQTSLVQFLERFDISMARSEKSPVIHKRIHHVIEYLTYEVFKYKARGLYEIHKYMFSLLMTLKIDLQRGNISHEEFEFFIKGGAALDLKTVQPKPCKWITDVTWLHLVALSDLKQFQYILTQVPASEKLWKLWFDKDTPEEEIIPDGYNNLDTFRRLLIIRAWCMDRTLSQSRKYIASSLGMRYAEAVITLLDVMHSESRPDTPMVCFLSMGSDPSPSIEQLAKNMEILCKSISMGQGQEVHARKLLNSAVTDGFWVLCQNCHLGLDYMNEMVIFILEMQSPHPDFRIWITTEPHPNFPISLLQMSIKFTYEPPQGVKAGLTATYSGMNQIMLDQCDVPQYIPLIYAVSFLHTVVQERRKFGPLGWNIPYEFNTADWLASCMFMNNHLNDFDPKRGISWQTVRYMIGEVQYGGRVTDDYDKRLLNTFAKVWFLDALFNEDFEFYKGYPVLNYNNIAEYLKVIDSMVSIDPPQVYGLHSNADITYQSNTTQAVLDTIISIQPKEAGVGSGESREMVVTRQAKDMLDKLPTPYDFFVVKERLNIMGITQPMNIFLKQEIDRINVVIVLLITMLNDLLLAIEGVIIMNEQLRDTFDNIYDARIPDVWRVRSWESSTLGFWFTELLERNQQFSTWLFTGRPMRFWMTGFFNPQGFLTAMRQEVTRGHEGWALDNVTLHNSIMRYYAEDIKSPPDEGVYVIGLILEGAGWDRRNNMLCESANKVLYVNMPVVYIFALYNKPDKDPKLYECPLYKKPQRTYNLLVTPLWLQTNKPPEHWILRGVALLCDNK